MKNYHIIALPRFGTKSVLGLITARMKREAITMSIKNDLRENSTKSGSYLGEFLHCRNAINFAYPDSMLEPMVAHAVRVKLTEQIPAGYHFLDYQYDYESDTLKWVPLKERRTYDVKYFFSLVSMLEQFQKPWIIKTFPTAFINNPFFNTSFVEVEQMLHRTGKISTPVILTRDFKSWLVSLYFGTKYGKFSSSQLTDEFLESINIEHTIPQRFIDAQSKQYLMFNQLVDLFYPTAVRYNIKDISKDPAAFLTSIGLHPIIENANAIEYSKLDYKKIIKNYDNLACTPHNGLSPYHL